jgi:hypothetical protein
MLVHVAVLVQADQLRIVAPFLENEFARVVLKLAGNELIVDRQPLRQEELYEIDELAAEFVDVIVSEKDGARACSGTPDSTVHHLSLNSFTSKPQTMTMNTASPQAGAVAICLKPNPAAVATLLSIHGRGLLNYLSRARRVFRLPANATKARA